MSNLIVRPKMSVDGLFHFFPSEIRGAYAPPGGGSLHKIRTHSLVSNQTTYNKKPHINLILLFEENNARPFMLITYHLYTF